jgi:Lysozyme like domain/Peptidase M15
MAVRTAEVIYVGDAASLIRASQEAAAATETATAKIAGANAKIGGSYLSMSGAGKKAASELESSHSRIASSLAGIASSGNLAVAGIVGIVAAAAAVKKSADTLGELTKTTLTLHNATGLSTSSASKFAAIAKVNDIAATGLTQAFGTLSKNVQAVMNAHDGLTKSAHTQEIAFKQLGVPVKDLVKDHYDMNKVLPEVLAKFEKMPGSTEKAALGMQLMGRGWKTLLPLLHEGALGLKEQEEEAKAMGVELGGDAATNAIKLEQAQHKLAFASLGLQVVLAEKVAPALTTMVGKFAELVKEIEHGSGKIGHAVNDIGAVFQTAAQIVRPLVQDIAQIVGGMGTTIAGTVHAIKGVLTLNFTEAWAGVKDIFGGGVQAALGVLNAAVGPFKHIGEEMIHGLVHGIEAGAGEVSNIAKKIANLPGEAIHDVLGIKSASKVMRQYGEYTAEGFAQGIEAGSAHVSKAMAFMASGGGFHAASGTNYSKGAEPQIARDLDALGKALGIKLTGISGYRTPQHSVEVGGFANDPHTRGEASDTEGAQKIAESVLEKFGLTRPFGGAKEANHIQLLAGSAAATAHTVVSHEATLREVAERAGFKGQALQTAVAVAMAESSGNRMSHATHGEDSRGLWQINVGPGANTQYANRELYDPKTNAEIAFQMSHGGTDWSAWSTYKSGAYRQYLGTGAGPVVGGSATTGGVSAVATKIAAAVAHLILSPAQKAKVTGLEGLAGAAHATAGMYGGYATEAGEAWEHARVKQEKHRQPLSTAAGAGEQGLIDTQDIQTAKARKLYYEREVRALGREAKAWGKLRDQYLSFARHAKEPAKKDALNKAAGFKGKVKAAEAEAKALGGTIAETAEQITEAQNVLSVTLPGEIAAAHAEQQSGDLGAYQAANAKVDLEERAGIITPEQAKAAKEANANRALGGGYGELSGEGRLQVQGDLREFSKTLAEANSQLEQHNQLLAESNKLQQEQLHASERISQVETGTLLKVISDLVSGQIGGVDYHGRQMTPGAGSAARY